MKPYNGSNLAASFRTVRKNTIQIAEEIPEEKYEYEAAPGVRTVGRMLTHIAVTPRIWYDIHGPKKMTDLNGYDFFGIFGQVLAEENQPRSKAEIIELLRSEGEKFAGFLESMTDEELAQTVTHPGGGEPPSRMQLLLSPKEHEMHHRAQLMLVQRMLGMVPHLTRQFQENMAKMQAARPAQQHA